VTNRQKRFCEEYLIDLNATQAAIYKPELSYSPEEQLYLVVSALDVLLDDNIKSISRKEACFLIIKYFVPNWQELFYSKCAPFDRHDARVTEWRNKVLQRDDYKCVRCGSTDNIEVHHVLKWAEYPRGRVDINNGITLCNECHAAAHITERGLILHRHGKG
jgi:hypothetical protein